MVGCKTHADTLNFQRLMQKNGNQTFNISGHAHRLGLETFNVRIICSATILISTLRLIKIQRKSMKEATSTMVSQTLII